MTTVIWWIRRDLRLADNPALSAALQSGERLLPLFILDPHFDQPARVGDLRRDFLLRGLRSLDAALSARGSRLFLRQGAPDQVLEALIHAAPDARIFAAEDFSPYARRRDGAIAARLPLHLSGHSGFRHPQAVLKTDGAPYTVFTPYMRTWRRQAFEEFELPAPAPAHLPSPTLIESEPLPSARLPENPHFRAGEAAAQRLLADFTAGEPPPLARYGETRNRPDLDLTSRLSPYLKFGMLSARQAFFAAQPWHDPEPSDAASGSAASWTNQLIWRDFFFSILYHFPHVAHGSFRQPLQRLEWIDDPQALARWQQGETGYPLVDAGMRQLSKSGWMHNRVRMIAASFLTKNLLIDWRLGERWFAENLIDADLANNNGGWQWVAGTGTDAAPYFRIFNPITQSKKFDPHGDYIRRWVPELARVPGDFIHQPWKMDQRQQRESGCRIDTDYPTPMIDLPFSRQRALAAYRLTR